VGPNGRGPEQPTEVNLPGPQKKEEIELYRDRAGRA
jgi:hypothetical protein